MSKEYVDAEMDEAYDRIKNGDFEAAVGQLKLIKLRIHDDKKLADIKQWEKEHDDELDKRIDAINISDKHLFDKQEEKMDEIFKYAQAYYRYYDALRKEYGIY